MKAIDEHGNPWSSVRLIEWLKAEDRTVLLAMSRGKDCLAAWTALADAGIPVVPFHMFLVPGLAFVEDSLAAIERHFGTHVYRMPHPFFYWQLRMGLYQTPHRRQILSEWVLPKFSTLDVERIVAEDHGLDPAQTWTVTGVRSADSPMRWTAMKRHGPVSDRTRKVHLVWDWTKTQLYGELLRHGVRLPIDYQWFGRSFDGLDYRFLQPIKQYAPDDYHRIQEWFPLCDVMVARYGLRGADA